MLSLPANRIVGTMRIVLGHITPKVASAELRRCWKDRSGNELAPPASLETDGHSFRISYETWDTGSLKHIFEIEVHRVSPSSKVTWSQGSSLIIGDAES
ncbi:hypothetical protein SBA7_970015 [Candidatus Sulfotelmatobacter sp. SbA7]|nr:hypothetical protein SBA7_970015 [Candidatus Sulfotelmatobacter sp. SbA7]